jgi:heme o synthase
VIRSKTQFLRDLLILSKLIISLAVTLTAFLGYIVYSGNFDFEALIVALGVFLMAAGSSALNHFQERDTDKLMIRTKDRPIPSGRMKAEEVLFISILFLLTGGIILVAFTNILSFLLAVLTFFWYNFVYTPLKKISAFAVFPGSVIGGLPPMIGWTAAGGQLNDPKIWIIFLFFFIGQIPHFWLILLMNGKDYEKAGLSSLTKLLTESRIRQLTFFWIVSTALASMALVVSEIIFSGTLVIVLSLGALLLVIAFIKLPFYRINTPEYRKDFILLNIFYMLVMLLVIAQYLLF